MREVGLFKTRLMGSMARWSCDFGSVRLTQLMDVNLRILAFWGRIGRDLLGGKF